MKNLQTLEYFKEALRLAELRLEEQNTTLTLQEKKAVLIATLAIAFVGYLLAFSGEIGTTLTILNRSGPVNEFWVLMIFQILPSVPSVFALAHSMASLNLMELGTRGAPPRYTLDDYFKGDLNELVVGLLEDYDERITNNQELLETKNKEMRKAKKWLFLGFACAVTAVLFRELLQVQTI